MSIVSGQCRISRLISKLDLSISVEGNIITDILTERNRANISIADELTANVYNCYIVENKGYDSDKHRENIRNNSNILVSPARKI